MKLAINSNKHFFAFLLTLGIASTASAQINIDTAKTIITPASLPYRPVTGNDKQDISKPGEEKNTTKEDPKSVRDAVKEFVEKDEAASKKKSAGNEGTQPAYLVDTRLDSVNLRSWKEYYGYMEFGYKHRRNVFAWQMFSSKVIFYIVIGLVLIGIYFAWLQFNFAMKNSKKAGDLGKQLETEISASGKEFKVSSPVLGVIILLISLMFFYLYLRYVYPINEVF